MRKVLVAGFTFFSLAGSCGIRPGSGHTGGDEPPVPASASPTSTSQADDAARDSQETAPIEKAANDTPENNKPEPLAGKLNLVSATAGGKSPMRAPHPLPLPGTPPPYGSANIAAACDGEFVAFTSSASDLVDGDTNDLTDVFLKNLRTGDIQRVNVSSIPGQEGQQMMGTPTRWENGRIVAEGDDALDPAISCDGRYIVYVTKARNLVTQDTLGVFQVFLYDRGFDNGPTLPPGRTFLISGRYTDPADANTFAAANGHAGHPDISPDGQFVAYSSYGTNLVDNDTNGERDIFLFDRRLTTVTRINVAEDGTQANGDSMSVALSINAAYVAFDSRATTLASGLTSGISNVFVYNRAEGRMQVISSAGNGNDAQSPVMGGDGRPFGSYTPRISHSGRYVSFESGAVNLPTDRPSNSVIQIYRYDTFLGTMKTASAGNASAGNNHSLDADISPDGCIVAWESNATNLLSAPQRDSNGKMDVYVRDLCGGNHLPEIVSLHVSGALAQDHSSAPRLTRKGVVFQSLANLLREDGNSGFFDVYSYSGTFESLRP